MNILRLVVVALLFCVAGCATQASVAEARKANEVLVKAVVGKLVQQDGFVKGVQHAQLEAGGRLDRISAVLVMNADGYSGLLGGKDNPLTPQEMAGLRASAKAFAEQRAKDLQSPPPQPMQVLPPDSGSPPPPSRYEEVPVPKKEVSPGNLVSPQPLKVAGLPPSTEPSMSQSQPNPQFMVERRTGTWMTVWCNRRGRRCRYVWMWNPGYVQAAVLYQPCLRRCWKCNRWYEWYEWGPAQDTQGFPRPW